MSISELKTCWSGHNFKAMKWWEKPLACVYAAFNVATCAIGFHSNDDFLDGTLCVWCGHKSPTPPVEHEKEDVK